MKQILKHTAGIDVAQKELVVCLGRIHDDFTIDFYAHEAFDNNTKGFESLVVWMTKRGCGGSTPFNVVMEATGVYHERLAYFLVEHNISCSVVMPSKISNYQRTLDVKTITDHTASQAIARFGLERRLDTWQKPNPVYRQLRQLTRERDQVITERTVVKNQLHAEQSEARPHSNTLKRLHARLAILDAQEKEIEADVKALLSANKDVKSQVRLITTIPGIGDLTACIILAETNGFELIRSRRQLASYAGFDVKDKQSGTSIKGKAHISKRGNKYLRKAMYFPALTAKRWDRRVEALFVRLVAKHGIKMKGAVAVQRKLLEMSYSIFKTQKPYDKNYLNPSHATTNQISELATA